LVGVNVAQRSLYSDPQLTYSLSPPSFTMDLNGDGLADIFVKPTLLGGPAVWTSRGNGNFDLAPGIDACYFPSDANGDGRTDCLCVGPYCDGAQVTLTVGTGTSAFRSANFNLRQPWTSFLETAAANSLFTGLLVADLNGDGRTDILRWKDDPTQNVLYLSNGDGTFRQSSSFNLYGAGYKLRSSDGQYDFVLGDFLGRGVVDILRLKAGADGLTDGTSNVLYVRSSPVPGETLLSATGPTGRRVSR
jgi:hypothetical protein